MKKQQETILAIDPTVRGFGFVVFEGSGTPIDWGQVTIRLNKNWRCRTRIRKLVDLYSPDAVVLETPEESLRHKRVRRLLKNIAVEIQHRRRQGDHIGAMAPVAFGVALRTEHRRNPGRAVLLGFPAIFTGLLRLPETALKCGGIGASRQCLHDLLAGDGERCPIFGQAQLAANVRFRQSQNKADPIRFHQAWIHIGGTLDL